MVVTLLRANFVKENLHAGNCASRVNCTACTILLHIEPVVTPPPPQGPFFQQTQIFPPLISFEFATSDISKVVPIHNLIRFLPQVCALMKSNLPGHCRNAMTRTQTISWFSVRGPGAALSPLAIHFECVQISVFC